MHIPSPSPAPWKFSDVLVLVAGLVVAVALTRGLAMGLAMGVRYASSPALPDVQSTPSTPEDVPLQLEPRVSPPAPPASLTPPPAQSTPADTRELQEKLGSLVSPPSPAATIDPPAAPPPVAPPPAAPPPAVTPAPAPQKPAEVVDPDLVWVAGSGDKVYHRRRDCPSLTGMFKRASLKQLIGHTACPVCVR